MVDRRHRGRGASSATLALKTIRRPPRWTIAIVPGGPLGIRTSAFTSAWSSDTAVEDARPGDAHTQAKLLMHADGFVRPQGAHSAMIESLFDMLDPPPPR